MVGEKLHNFSPQINIAYVFSEFNINEMHTFFAKKQTCQTCYVFIIIAHLCVSEFAKYLFWKTKEIYIRVFAHVNRETLNNKGSNSAAVARLTKAMFALAFHEVSLLILFLQHLIVSFCLHRASKLLIPN